MRKVLLGIAALTVLYTSSCKKSDDDTTAPVFYWKVGSDTYPVIHTSYQQTGGGYRLIAIADSSAISIHSITFQFNVQPATGTYLITKDVSGINNKAVSVVAAGYDGITATSYQTTGYDSLYANVTIDSGRVSVTMPDATAKSTFGTDSLKISATGIRQTL